MKNFSFILITMFLVSINVTSQNNKLSVFQLKSQVNSTSLGTYDVSNLFLHKNGYFEIQYQKYSNKKDFRDNVIYKMIIKKGQWIKKDNNIIELEVKDNSLETKEKIYFVKSKKNIVFYLNSLDNFNKIKFDNNYAWKKIR